ncbi:hypothetical protein [Sphingosinicella soli]|uniref:Uncharacterized protein n=1 Tax=Sphingosinicella soli TaxID=333708 RepID=A0A7W7FA06_9SPHN|nr:hypothetical protein [Sphingosinicella soli]MBB4633203.1 hypothetical protein [Sphingosinicella soli]
MIPISKLKVAYLGDCTRGQVLMAADHSRYGSLVIGRGGELNVAVQLGGDDAFSLMRLENAESYFGVVPEDIEFLVDPTTASSTNANKAGTLSLQGDQLGIYAKSPNGQARLVKIRINDSECSPQDREIWFSRWSVVQRLASGDSVTLYNFDLHAQ